MSIFEVRDNSTFTDADIPAGTTTVMVYHCPLFVGDKLPASVTNIVVLSADAVAHNIEKALHLGAKGFMVKPFSRQTLVREFNRCPSIVFDDGAMPELA